MKKKETRYDHNQANNNNNGNHYRENYDSQDMVFIVSSKNESFTEYCKNLKGIFNDEEIKESITVGNCKSIIATKVGNLKCRFIQIDGSGLDFNIHEVKFVHEGFLNWFSVNKGLNNGSNLNNQDLSISLSKGSVSVKFDGVMRKTNGSVSGIKMLVHEPPIV
jgi:hypothetical protein